jgi:opacity protein-like surface antigen
MGGVGVDWGIGMGRAKSLRYVGSWGALTFAISVFANASALAQNCGTATVTGPVGPFLANAAIAGGAAAGAFSGALGNLNTAFLTQQGSAFVSAPGDPKPDQPGGGVWVRGVGGEVTNKFTSNSTSSLGPVAVSTASITNCPGQVRQNFAGIQAGQDISRLNWNGWNIHVGTTAGYLGSHAVASTGATSDFEVPFLGGYLVATHGRFFADVMVREEFYNASLTDPNVGLNGQRLGAHGLSVSTSAGYNFALANNWFIEPSAGFIWSRTDVDPINIPGTGAGAGFVSTFTTNPIESDIGRLSVRAGTSFTSGNIVWQPFGSASVFHEFAGDVTSTAATGPNSAFVGAVPITITGQSSTTRVGTYGQYSLGLAAQVVDTGWLGFVRVDYRNGQNIDGWTGNAGIRYQFTPEMIASVMPVKVKAPPHPYIAPTNWTGFYVGGFAGAAAGRADIQFVGTPFPSAGNRPWVFGGLGGLELGYNYQFANNWVLGAEADIGATNANGARTAGTVSGLAPTGLSVGFSPAFFTLEEKTNWMATATARLGYAWGRTLFYAKGGAAFDESSTNVSCIFGPGGQVPIGFGFFRSCINQAGAVTGGFSTPWSTHVGWTVGYGTEFDLGHNWSAKAEYDYLSFGRHAALATDGTTVLTEKTDISQVKIGVNYKFAPNMIAAKY